MTSTDSIRFICGGCGYRARIPSNYQDKVILCPGCQQMQIATADGSDPTGDTVRYNRVSTAQGTDRFSKPDDSGRLIFTCNSCSFQAKLAATYAGKAISCPKCNSPQLIPPLEPAGGPPAGKNQPPLAESPAAGARNNDDLSFADDSHSAAKQAVSNASTLSADPEDEQLSFDEPPKAQAPKPRPSDKPSGVVKRRSSRMAMPTMPPPEEDMEEEPPKPAKPLPVWAEKAKQPKALALGGGGLALLIIVIVLITGWSSASSLAEKNGQLAKDNQDKAETENKARKDAEWKLSESENNLAKSKKSEEEAKAALAASELRAKELNEKIKSLEDEKQDEYTKRKKAEADHDAIFAKLKSLEAAREEDYRISTDLRKKYEEELKLRKELSAQLKALIEENKKK